MATYFIKPDAADNTGTGTAASPKKTLTGITLSAGDIVRFLRGTTYSDTFAPTVAGTSAAHIIYGAYANADGSDNAAMPRPIINLATAVSTYGSTNKDYVDYFNLDVRATLTVANDASVFFAGAGSTFRNVRIDTNVGCIASWNKSNVTIQDCELNGVSHSSANNNNVVTVSADNTNIDNIKLLNNVINHKGGGGTASHVVRAETSSISYVLTRLKVKGNIVLSPNGAEKNPNLGAIGLRLGRCPGVVVDDNKVYGVLSGVFVTGAGAIITGGKIRRNNFSYCYNFGIHLAGYTRDFIIERNVTWYNGTDIGASYYGRGIELSAQAGQGTNGGHILRLNSCRYNKNYGGPADNGSEGPGIGLDDGVDRCEVYGNDLSFNEGNGLQHYGNAGTQTGGHRISGNYFESNCTASFKNRRTGGTTLTAFNAHCTFANHVGETSYVVNNYFIGSTLAGISETSNSNNNIVKANNIFVDVRYPICMAAGRGQSFSNLFYAPTVTMQRYSDTTLDSNGAPTFPSVAFTGDNDLSFTPVLDAKKRPRTGSNCIGVGKHIGRFYDMAGRPFNDKPSIGPYEFFSTVMAA